MHLVLRARGCHFSVESPQNGEAEGPILEQMPGLESQLSHQTPRGPGDPAYPPRGSVHALACWGGTKGIVSHPCSFWPHAGLVSGVGHEAGGLPLGLTSRCWPAGPLCGPHEVSGCEVPTVGLVCCELQRSAPGLGPAVCVNTHVSMIIIKLARIWFLSS